MPSKTMFLSFAEVATFFTRVRRQDYLIAPSRFSVRLNLSLIFKANLELNQDGNGPLFVHPFSMNGRNRAPNRSSVLKAAIPLRADQVRMTWWPVRPEGPLKGAYAAVERSWKPVYYASGGQIY